MSGDPGTCRVSVSAEDLAAAWKTLKRTTSAKNRGELLVLRRDDDLVFELGGAAIGVPVEGTWLGQARLDASRLFGLLPHLPKRGSVLVAREGDRLRVDRVSFPCVWDPEPTSPLRLPMNPSFIELLWVGERWPRADLAVAGVLPLVQSAESKRDELLSKASRALKPLGITEEELRELVRRRVNESHGGEG